MTHVHSHTPAPWAEGESVKPSKLSGSAALFPSACELEEKESHDCGVKVFHTERTYRMVCHALDLPGYHWVPWPY